MSQIQAALTVILKSSRFLPTASALPLYPVCLNMACDSISLDKPAHLLDGSLLFLTGKGQDALADIAEASHTNLTIERLAVGF